MASFESDDPEAFEKMRAMFGPGQVDCAIRNANHMCWMSLPNDNKTVDELEEQLRRIFDRAIKDLRDDSEAFGLGK